MVVTGGRGQHKLRSKMRRRWGQLDSEGGQACHAEGTDCAQLRWSEYSRNVGEENMEFCEPVHEGGAHGRRCRGT